MPTRTRDLTFRFRSLCMNCWTSTTPTSHGMVHAGTVASRFDTGTWAVPISWMEKTKTRHSNRKLDTIAVQQEAAWRNALETLQRKRNVIVSTSAFYYCNFFHHDTRHYTPHRTPNKIIRRNTAQRYTQGTEVWKSIRQMPRFVHHDIHSTRLTTTS